MSYIYMRKHHKRTVHSGGATLDGKIPLSLMTKGESLYVICRGQSKRKEAWFQGEHE
jgi:hypothetical protein